MCRPAKSACLYYYLGDFMTSVGLRYSFLGLNPRVLVSVVIVVLHLYFISSCSGIYCISFELLLLLRFHFDSIVRKCFYVEFIHIVRTCVVLLVPWEIILLGSVGWLPPNDNPFLVHVFFSSFSSWNFHS